MATPREWTPVALLAQVMAFYHRYNGWPTVQELITHTGLPPDQVRSLLDVLLDRRLVQLDGETVYPWEAGPSPVVTYKLSPEEIAARYGPPARPGDRAEARRQVAGELLGCWPERSPNTTAKEESERMPTGQRVNWPDPRELVAMADELNADGRNAAAVIAARLGVSPATVRKKLQEARHVVTLLQLKDAGVLTPEETSETPDPGEAPSPADVMVEAEVEANRLVEASLAKAEPSPSTRAPLPPAVEGTPGSGPQNAPVAGGLSTFRRMLLVDPDRVAAVRELDHVTRAPEKPGDHWAQPVRRQGFLRWREWVCVAVLADGTCLMVPPAAARAAEESVERRTA